MENQKRIKGEIMSVTLGERAITFNFEMPLDPDDWSGHFKQLCERYWKKRLTGTLLRGEEDPDQTVIDDIDRTMVKGAFDTGKISGPGSMEYNKQVAKFSLSFDDSEVAHESVWRMKYSDAWLVIDDVSDIPKPEKSTGAQQTLGLDDGKIESEDVGPADNWESHPITKTRLSAAKVATLNEEKIMTIGDLVRIIDNGEIANKKGFGPAAVGALHGVMGDYFESIGVDNPIPEPTA